MKREKIVITQKIVVSQKNSLDKKFHLTYNLKHKRNSYYKKVNGKLKL